MFRTPEEYTLTLPGKNHICSAELENREIHVYHMCDKARDAYQDLENSGRIQYIGAGRIYKLGGVAQPGIDQYHFWKRVRQKTNA